MCIYIYIYIFIYIYSMCCARTAALQGGRRSVSECKNGFHAELTHYLKTKRSSRRPRIPERRPRSAKNFTKTV